MSDEVFLQLNTALLMNSIVFVSDEQLHLIRSDSMTSLKTALESEYNIDCIYKNDVKMIPMNFKFTWKQD